MNGQEYLLQIWDIDKEIKAKLEQCERLRDIAARTSSALSSERVEGGKKSNSRLEDCVVKLTMLENDLRYSVYELARLKSEAIKKIRLIKDVRSRVLLIERYVNCKTWEQVAWDLGMSYVHVFHRLHPKALEFFEEIFKM